MTLENDPELDRAMQRLRAADPAASMDGTWSEGRADELRAQPASKPHRTALLSLSAAAGVAAVAVVAVALSQSSPATGPTAGGPPIVGSTMTPSTGPIQLTPKSRTEQLVRSLLHGVPDLPGAQSTSTLPSPALKDAPESSVGPNLVDRHAYWTAPGTVERALDYYRAHRPDGLDTPGDFSSSSGLRALTFDVSDRSYARQLEVEISVVALDPRHVAVRADAYGFWVPDRDPETLLRDVTSIDVTVHRGGATNPSGIGGAPTIHHVLRGDDAQRVAHAVDALPVAIPGMVYNCPLQRIDFDDVLLVPTSAGTIRIDATVTGCAGVTITLTDGSKASFEAGTLDATVLKVLGLPKNYGD